MLCMQVSEISSPMDCRRRIPQKRIHLLPIRTHSYRVCAFDHERHPSSQQKNAHHLGRSGY